MGFFWLLRINNSSWGEKSKTSKIKQKRDDWIGARKGSSGDWKCWQWTRTVPKGKLNVSTLSLGQVLGMIQSLWWIKFIWSGQLSFYQRWVFTELPSLRCFWRLCHYRQQTTQEMETCSCTCYVEEIKNIVLFNARYIEHHNEMLFQNWVLKADIFAFHKERRYFLFSEKKYYVFLLTLSIRKPKAKCQSKYNNHTGLYALDVWDLLPILTDASSVMTLFLIPH